MKFTPHQPWIDCRDKRCPGGFTLTELLVALGIIGVIVAFAVPATNTVLRCSQLTQGAQLVGDQLALARQQALSSNHTVEIRFYRYGDSQIPGEVATNPSTGKYRAMQSFQIQDSGSVAALGKIQTMPSSIVIDSGTTLSSLLGSSQQKTWTSPGDSQLNLSRGVGVNYKCSAFRFLPDGSTNLTPPTAQWFLTLHSITDGDALAKAPANFFTVQIDATNGHIKNFRP